MRAMLAKEIIKTLKAATRAAHRDANSPATPTSRLVISCELIKAR